MLKKLIFIALLFIIIGVVGSIISYSSSNNTTEINQTQSIDYENIEAIHVNTVSTNVEIISSKEQKEATIKLIGKVKETAVPELLFEVHDNELIIDIQQSTENHWFNFNVDFDSPTLTLKLYVPEKLVNNITFKSVSSDLYLDNVRAHTMKISSTSGDIDGENVQFESAHIATVSGDMKLEETVGEVAIKTTSGDIYLTMADIVHPIQVNSISGDVEIVTSSVPTNVKFKVKSVSGDINILDEYNGSTVIGKGTTLVEINTTSADISVESY